MKCLFILGLLLTTQVFAQKECYFDQRLADGSYGFILQDNEIYLLNSYRPIRLARVGNNLIDDGVIVGKLDFFLPRGILTLNSALMSFTCTTRRTVGHP